MSSDLISIIMPVYNVEKYVGAAIQSILDQSYKDFELIIVDDCSPDNSIDVIQSFADPRIRIIRLGKNQGVAYARNLAIADAKGSYLAFLDSDDVMVQHRLIKQLAFMRGNPEISISAGWGRAISPENLTEPYIYKILIDPTAINPSLIFGNLFSTSTVMMRKEAALPEGFRQRYAEDYDYWIRAAQRHKLGIVRELFVDYRRRTNSAMHTYAMENKKQDIWNSQSVLFDALKIKPTEQEKDIHLFARTNIGNIDCGQLMAIYNWYMKLIEANRQARVYAEDAFLLAASYMWFKHLFRATGCGFEALRMYFGRTLSLAHPQPISMRVKFIIKAIMRRKFIRVG